MRYLSGDNRQFSGDFSRMYCLGRDDVRHICKLMVVTISMHFGAG